MKSASSFCLLLSLFTIVGSLQPWPHDAVPGLRTITTPRSHSAVARPELVISELDPGVSVLLRHGFGSRTRGEQPGLTCILAGSQASVEQTGPLFSGNTDRLFNSRQSDSAMCQNNEQSPSINVLDAPLCLLNLLSSVCLLCGPLCTSRVRVSSSVICTALLFARHNESNP